MAQDYTGALLQAVAALAITAGLAYLFLRFLAARGPFGRSSGQGKLQVEERLRINPKGSLLVVHVEGRRLLLATHLDRPARLIVELGSAAIPPEGEP